LAFVSSIKDFAPIILMYRTVTLVSSED